jgi:hypothetical protein
MVADVDKPARRRKPTAVSSEPNRLIRRSSQGKPEDDQPGDDQ